MYSSENRTNVNQTTGEQKCALEFYVTRKIEIILSNLKKEGNYKTISYVKIKENFETRSEILLLTK